VPPSRTLAVTFVGVYRIAEVRWAHCARTRASCNRDLNGGPNVRGPPLGGGRVKVLDFGVRRPRLAGHWRLDEAVPRYSAASPLIQPGVVARLRWPYNGAERRCAGPPPPIPESRRRVLARARSPPMYLGLRGAIRPFHGNDRRRVVSPVPSSAYSPPAPAVPTLSPSLKRPSSSRCLQKETGRRDYARCGSGSTAATMGGQFRCRSCTPRTEVSGGGGASWSWTAFVYPPPGSGSRRRRADSWPPS
jgi:hypothetical protein